MREYEEAIKKLNVDQEFKMHITEEEDERLMYESSMELAEERGEKLGLKKGAIEVAKKMVNKGKSIEEIQELTELSLDEIKILMS